MLDTGKRNTQIASVSIVETRIFACVRATLRSVETNLSEWLFGPKGKVKLTFMILDVFKGIFRRWGVMNCFNFWFFGTYSVTGSSGLKGEAEIAADIGRRDAPGDLPLSSTWKENSFVVIIEFFLFSSLEFLRKQAQWNRSTGKLAKIINPVFFRYLEKLK